MFLMRLVTQEPLVEPQILEGLSSTRGKAYAEIKVRAFGDAETFRYLVSSWIKVKKGA